MSFVRPSPGTGNRRAVKDMLVAGTSCTIGLIVSTSLNVWRQETSNDLLLDVGTQVTAILGVIIIGCAHDNLYSWGHLLLFVYAVLHALSLAIATVIPLELRWVCALISWLTGGGLLAMVWARSKESTMPYVSLGLTTMAIGAGRLVAVVAAGYEAVVFFSCAGALMVYTTFRFIYPERQPATKDAVHPVYSIKLLLVGVLSLTMEAAGWLVWRHIPESRLHVGSVYLASIACSGVGAVLCWLRVSRRGVACACSVIVCVTGLYLLCTGETLKAAHIIYASMGLGKVPLLSLMIDGSPDNSMLCFGLTIYVGILASQMIMMALTNLTKQLHAESLLVVTSCISAVSVWFLTGYKDLYRLPVLKVGRCVSEVTTAWSYTNDEQELRHVVYES